jgi:hypothetical protein
MSPGALPTMLMGKLMNVTNLFGNSSNSGENTAATVANKEEEGEELEEGEEEILSSSDNEYEPSEDTTHHHSLFSSINKIPSSTAKKLKRNSLFFNKSPSYLEPATVTITTDSPSPPTTTALSDAPTPYASASPEDNHSGISSGDLSTALDETTTPKSSTRPRSGTFNNLSKIPRAVSDAIRHQVLRSDELSSSASLQLPPPPTEQQQGRNRSSSLSTLRHHMSPFYLYNKINSSPASSSSETVNAELSTRNCGDISLISSTSLSMAVQSPAPINKTRTQRATSLGSMLLSSGSKTWHKFTPSTDLQMNEGLHRHPKGPMWLSAKMTQELKEALEGASSSSEGSACDEEEIEIPQSMEHATQVTEEVNPHILQEEQQAMNDNLNANFPMLLKTETVEAAFVSLFWRTIPYSGKIYITDKYFCFKSKILAGQQKLIVPWTDVIQVDKLKSKSYYLVHGMTMVVKNMTDEVKVVSCLRKKG